MRRCKRQRRHLALDLGSVKASLEKGTRPRSSFASITRQPNSRGSSYDTASVRRRIRASPGFDINESIHLTQFSDFALGESILRAVAEQGHSAPTPIQAQAISPILAGRDICGIAQTGTGKTAAFALPILERLSHSRSTRVPGRPRVLVLTPTRELASQVAQSFRTYGAGLRLSVSAIFGGVSQRPQEVALKRGVDIFVATPGRLLDLINQRHPQSRRRRESSSSTRPTRCSTSASSCRSERS